MIRVLRGVGLAALLFALVQVGALALVAPFDAAGYQAVENPQNPTNSLVYLGAILVVTALMLAAFKFELDRVVQAVIVFSSGLLAWYVFDVFIPSPWSLLPAAGVAVALLVYPEWYVIDAAGVVMGAGGAALFGLSFGLLPAIVLLVALAVYDAISVYGTEHMLDLASGVMSLRLPVVLVIPLSWSYSLLDEDFENDDEGEGENETDADGDGDDAVDADGDTGADGDTSDAGDASDDDFESPSFEERDVFFIGLGDAVMPTVLVASAAFFSPASSLGIPFLPALNLPALGGMLGTFAGLAILLRMVLRGEAHAGLPLLNGGTVLGYLVGSVAAGVSVVSAVGL